MKSLEIRLAFRNVFRQGLRSLMPIVVSAIACLVIILVGGLYQYLFRSLEISTIRDEGHLSVRAASSGRLALSAARLDAIRAIPGVAIATPRATISGIVGIGDRASVFSGLAVDPALETRMRQFPGTGPGYAAPVDQTAAVGVVLARGLGATTGAWLSGLAGDQGFSAQVGKQVHTEAEEKDRYYLELPFTALAAMPWRQLDSLHVQVNALSDLAPIGAAIMELFAADGGPQPVIRTFDDPAGYISSVKAIYGNNLLFIMAVLTLAVFLGVATAFTMAIAERSGELGTIRSFGAPPGHIRRLFHFESLFVSVLGFAAGLALTLGLAWLINGQGGLVLPPPPTATAPLRVGFVFHAGYAALALVIVVVVGQASTALVTARLGRLSIIRQLGLNS